MDAIGLALGATIEFVSSPASLLSVAADSSTLVILDLACPGAIEALADLPKDARSIGFGSHVDRGLLKAAKAAGCGQVLARSAIFNRFAEIIERAR